MKDAWQFIGVALICWFFSWAWPYLKDAGELAALLGLMALSCPWVGVVAFVIWWVWDEEKKVKEKRRLEAEDRERLREVHSALMRLEVEKVRSQVKKNAEDQGVARSVWRWN